MDDSRKLPNPRILRPLSFSNNVASNGKLLDPSLIVTLSINRVKVFFSIFSMLAKLLMQPVNMIGSPGMIATCKIVSEGLVPSSYI